MYNKLFFLVTGKVLVVNVIISQSIKGSEYLKSGVGAGDWVGGRADWDV